jgi:signal transduction histidine kinase
LRTGAGPAAADTTVTHAMIRGQVSAGDDDGDLVVAVPITDHGRLTGVLRAATTTTEITQRTALTWATMLALAALAITATWLFTRRMAAHLARPLEQLATAAHRLGEGDFTVRTTRAGIPEIDSVGAALDGTATRLGETIERERAFSANASHQLRTPLAGLRLHLEAALEHPDQDPREALAGGIAAADRLEAIIDDLLTLARHTPAPMHPVDLDELLTEVRTHWHGPLAAKGRALRIAAVDGRQAPRPLASTAAVRQILAVLVDNAATHGQGTVTVTIRDTAAAVAIDVADEGPGIDLARNPFTRPTPNGAPGHGIGLALARGLAEAEGGRLLLSQPAPPTFTLLLPNADELSEDPATPG